MASSADNNVNSSELASASSLVLLMILIFAVVAIYELVYRASSDWVLFKPQGSSISSRSYEFEVIGTTASLVLYAAVILLVRFVPDRKAAVEPKLLYAAPFFIIAYLAILTGTVIYSLFYAYLLPPNVSFSFSLDRLFFVSPISFSVGLTIAGMGALYSRQVSLSRLRNK